MTALAGALYCQYQIFISSGMVNGTSVSSQMVFAAMVSGICVLLAPTVCTVITVLLAEVLRIGFGTGTVSCHKPGPWCTARAVHDLPAAGARKTVTDTTGEDPLALGNLSAFCLFTVGSCRSVRSWSVQTPRSPGYGQPAAIAG